MLTPEEKSELKAKLARAKQDITAEIENLSTHDSVTDFGSDVDHFDEEADEAEELGNQLSIIQALKERLNNVERALAKCARVTAFCETPPKAVASAFANDTYGVCENCGKEIDKELLTAAPESRLCRACKTASRER